MVYEAPMKDDYGHRVLRVRLYELGHTFEEIDQINMKDLGDITSYWLGKSKAEAKLRKMNKPRGAKGQR